MAKKKEIGKIRLQIVGGKATPAPPIGPALGGKGVNIMGFCQEFNARTKDRAGDVLPVVITVYQDKSFTFITKEPPVPVLIKKEAGLQSGSAVPNRDKVGKLTRQQVNGIAQRKAEDMNAASMEAAERMVEGTARSMGVDIVD